MRDLHQEVDVAAHAGLVAEVVLEAVAAVLLHVEAGLNVPAPSPPLADVVRVLQAGDLQACGELPLVEAPLHVPRLADAVEKRVEDLAEEGEEGGQPFERRVAVGHFRRGPPDA